MRIISGYFRGRKILEPIDIKTRPLKDLTKESIFNVISHSNKLLFSLENSNILDLFSGIGSFGLECISRGSKFVFFLEETDKTIFIYLLEILFHILRILCLLYSSVWFVEMILKGPLKLFGSKKGIYYALHV